MPGIGLRMARVNCDEVLSGRRPVMAPVLSGRTVRSGLGAWVRATIGRFAENLVPLGYEDATGFHFGVETAEMPSAQPSAKRH